MTPAELAERGLRVKPLRWLGRDDGNRHCADDYTVTHDGWGFVAKWFGCEVGHESTLEAAKAAADAHHAAMIAAMIEVME